MFRDAREIPKNRLIERDICVIGAGAAGITVALELAATGSRILLIDSGGLEPNPATQALYAGTVENGYLGSGSDYLTTSRLRFFGGTTNHWAGLCGRMAAIDLRKRSWIPGSGWPFDPAELEPFYARAEPILDIGPFDVPDPSLKPFDFGPGAGIGTIVKQYSPPTRFGPVFGPALRAAKTVEVVLRGNVTELQSDSEARRIESIRVVTLEGNHFRVAARTFVLATGGIENARLLLASGAPRSNGLGNEHDLVGRFFMDHWYQQLGVARVVLAAPPNAVALYNWPPQRDTATGRVTQGRFVLSNALQAEHRLPNDGFGLIPLKKPERVPLIHAVSATTRALAPPDPGGTTLANLTIDLEPLPSPDNRVTLGDAVNALGSREPILLWDLTPGDRDGALRSLSVFAAELGRSLRGRVRIEWTPRHDWRKLSYSAHHIGTTRMHEDPKEGVVDPNGRVHRLSNLYVTGSSVFPTAGLVNPN